MWVLLVEFDVLHGVHAMILYLARIARMLLPCDGDDALPHDDMLPCGDALPCDHTAPCDDALTCDVMMLYRVVPDALLHVIML